MPEWDLAPISDALGAMARGFAEVGHALAEAVLGADLLHALEQCGCKWEWDFPPGYLRGVRKWPDKHEHAITRLRKGKG